VTAFILFATGVIELTRFSNYFYGATKMKKNNQYLNRLLYVHIVKDKFYYCNNIFIRYYVALSIILFLLYLLFLSFSPCVYIINDR